MLSKGDLVVIKRVSKSAIRTESEVNALVSEIGMTVEVSHVYSHTAIKVVYKINGMTWHSTLIGSEYEPIFHL